jgi:ABC-type multidrug transport system ATPase subunit
MIHVKNLCKSYLNHEVLSGLNLTASPREVTLLIGANGVGKTTTLRILSGLLRPDAGDAFIGGHSIVRDRRHAQALLSYLPQTIVFQPRLTCEALLRFYADLRGISRDRIAHVLDRVGLRAHAHKFAGQLSGGLRQRLGLGIFLLPDAPVLLLDEPGLSLDPEWRDRLIEILQDEARLGKTVLITTHLLAEWEGVANRALLCHAGGKVNVIDPQHLRAEFAIINNFRSTNDLASTR